jgi:hypothetical protein
MEKLMNKYPELKADAANRKKRLLMLSVLSVALIALLVFGLYYIWLKPCPVKLDEGHTRDVSARGFRVRVWAKVRNDGPAGTIKMRAWLNRDEKQFERTVTAPFEAGEVKEIDAEFSEPTFFDIVNKLHHRVEVERE